MSDEVLYENHSEGASAKISSPLVWVFTIASLVILTVGLWLQTPWWMLSTPLAIAGAIMAGMSRKFFPMVICIAVVALLVVVMLVFAP